MFTYKQLEALFWIVQLGGFGQAAQKLHATQAAISKRIQELEATFDTPLFDRSRRTASLTERGEELFGLATRLLAGRDAAVEQFSRPDVLVRRFGIGATELTALTWLPRLVHLIQKKYPKVSMEVEIAMGVTLEEKVRASQLDVAILPDAISGASLSTKLIASVECSWVCKPGLVQAGRRISMKALVADSVMLSQGKSSGTGVIFQRWMDSLGLLPGRTISCNSLLALLGMTISGLGVSYVPRECFSDLILQGLLQEIPTTPPLPAVPYVAVYRADRTSKLVSSVIELARSCCDFSNTFQIQRPKGPS